MIFIIHRYTYILDFIVVLNKIFCIIFKQKHCAFLVALITSRNNRKACLKFTARQWVQTQLSLFLFVCWNFMRKRAAQIVVNMLSGVIKQLTNKCLAHDSAPLILYTKKQDN